MQSKFYLIAISLMAVGLAACQRPDPGVVIDTPSPMAGEWAIVDDAGRPVLSIYLPAGWVAKWGGEDFRGPIVVTDNWEKYQNKDLDKEALGIIITPLTDKGTPEQILDTVVGRMRTMLTDRQGDVTLSEQGNQKYAWAEYAGKSIDDGTPLKYLLAVIATDQRSVFVFTSVLPDQIESVRPKFEEIVRGITLH